MLHENAETLNYLRWIIIYIPSSHLCKKRIDSNFTKFLYVEILFFLWYIKRMNIKRVEIQILALTLWILRVCIFNSNSDNIISPWSCYICIFCIKDVFIYSCGCILENVRHFKRASIRFYIHTLKFWQVYEFTHVSNDPPMLGLYWCIYKYTLAQILIDQKFP